MEPSFASLDQRCPLKKVPLFMDRVGKFLTVCLIFKFFLFLQAFIRDAEYVDSLSASHEAFLSNDDLGV